jgi:hypothetical protein
VVAVLLHALNQSLLKSNLLMASRAHVAADCLIFVGLAAAELLSRNIAGDRYSYADLDNFSDLIARTVQGAPETSKVERRGLLPQVVYLENSQDRLAEYGQSPARHLNYYTWHGFGSQENLMANGWKTKSL